MEHLPKVRGNYNYNFNISKITWFKVGGPASVFFKPADIDDLAFFLREKPKNIAHIIIGAASNVIFKDNGFKGVIIKLGKEFNTINFKKDCVEVGAACLDQILAKKTIEHNATGLEFLCGIPGTIGGAIAMNAGCYGKEMKDVVRWVDAINHYGEIFRFNNEDMKFSYRDCAISENMIFVKACLNFSPSSSFVVLKNIENMLEKRKITQPTHGATGGCTFANPLNSNKKAWELIREAGCLDLKIGGASFSHLHSNFMINDGSSSASDLETLGELVRKKVFDKFGIDLRWEIKIIGSK